MVMEKRSLKDLLEGQLEEESETDIEDVEMQVESGTCCECGDQPRELVCLACEEEFCQVCFDYLHRTGKRRDHNVQYFDKVDINEQNEQENGDKVEQKETSQPETSQPESAVNENEIENEITADSPELARLQRNAEFIPMRLTMEERKLFRLLEAALEVSEYTDRVDIYMYSSKAKRIVKELREICQVLCGLVVANGIDVGRDLVANQDYAANSDWFQTVFEIGRRYKIMNPERMRSNYGKMAYMIMDSRLPEVKQVLDFDLYKPVYTVKKHLELNEATKLLDEPSILVATMEIDSQLPRTKIQQEIRRKERAIEFLANKYGEKVRSAIYSLGDFYGYIAANQIPVANMIVKLKSNFDSETPQSEVYSLGIHSGQNGARLTHNHQRQYQYVLQSLTLWYEIMGDMYLLWKYADDDLLAETRRYRLEDTGQGLNRIKASPKVNRLMHGIISRAQQKTGSWVGSSVVHLGDTAVPNALFFLDKYLQVPRILNPVNAAIKLLPKILSEDIYANEWAETQFGSVEVLLKSVLTDFFRYAFDGSGADNFYDAGSCIDGRLTSAWNWANKLQKKPYYKYFLITGFVGFNGSEGF